MDQELGFSRRSDIETIPKSLFCSSTMGRWSIPLLLSMLRVLSRPSFGLAVISAPANSWHAIFPYSLAISSATSCESTIPITLSFCNTGNKCVSAAAIFLQISFRLVVSSSVGTKNCAFAFERFFIMFPTFIFDGSILLVRRNLLLTTPKYFLPSNTSAECVFVCFSLPNNCEIVSLTSTETYSVRNKSCAVTMKSPFFNHCYLWLVLNVLCLHKLYIAQVYNRMQWSNIIFFLKKRCWLR